jgi:hypothetical protein
LERFSVIPSDSELETAQSPLDLGRLYGYPEEDIAHYYWSRRREVINAHTARTLGLTLPPTLRSCRRVIE